MLVSFQSLYSAASWQFQQMPRLFILSSAEVVPVVPFSRGQIADHPDIVAVVECARWQLGQETRFISFMTGVLTMIFDQLERRCLSQEVQPVLPASFPHTADRPSRQSRPRPDAKVDQVEKLLENRQSAQVRGRSRCSLMSTSRRLQRGE